MRRRMKSRLRGDDIQAVFSEFRVNSGIEFAARYLDKAKVSEGSGQGFIVPSVLMLCTLSKVIIDVIQLRFTPFGMNCHGKRPIGITIIPVGSQRPFRIRDTDIKDSTRAQDSP